MKRSYLPCESTIKSTHDKYLSDVINVEYNSNLRTSAFLGILSTVLYRKTYNESFNIPLYFLANNHRLSASSEHNFIKKSFTFDSTINPTLEELSHIIKNDLESFDSQATEINNEIEIKDVVVFLADQPFSSELEDKAQALQELTNSQFTYILCQHHDLIEIFYLQADSSDYQCIPEYMHNLVKAIEANPEQCIHSFNILSIDEIEKQLNFGRGEKINISAQPVYKQIENFATQTPDKLAVSCGTDNLTYYELNSEANKLAHFLVKSHITTGDIVIAFLPRSTDIVKVILAIHKVGAVYVPIDPNFPPERILAILTEVQPKLILTHSQGEEIFAELNIPRLNLEHSAESLNSFPLTNPDIDVNLDQESHIFFTSGTTGKPKGVVATQKNLVHYLSVARNKYKFNHHDKFISASRFTFSINLFKILTPLYIGGSLRILQQDDILNWPKLCQEIQEATVFHFGPSLLKQLLPYIEKNFTDFSCFSKIKHVSSGGDMVPPDILEKLKKIFVNAEVFVIYGSSEISCMGCTYEVPRNITIEKTKVGKPHQNMSVRIFDKHGNMVPIGSPGKLYFAGDGLVKGYLNREDLTAEKFVKIEGQRFYSIGDVGRFDQQGNIELLGRDDFQVQIRGMRVELPEIEYYLKRFPKIADCVVVSRIVGNNSYESLIAYLVFKNNSDQNDSEIREYLNHILPDYMIPNIFVKLDKLPTNLNGKIDRRSLPLPDISSLSQNNFVPPNTATEKKLTAIWSFILGLKNIGIHDNFFELGGHSLTVTQIVSEIRENFSLELPLQKLFEYPTIAELAQVIEYESSNKTKTSQQSLFLFHDVDGEIGVYLNLTRHLDSQLPVYVLQPYSKANFPILHTRISDMVAYYIKKIRTIQPKGPYLLGGLSAGGILAFEAACQLQAQGEEVGLVALLDAPDVKAEMKKGRIAKQRLSRFSQLFKQSRQVKKKDVFSYLGKTMIKKIINTINYEINGKVNQIKNKFQIRLYRYYLDNKLAIPKICQNITIRQIFEFATQEYTPSHFQGRVTLFRATKSVIMDDPLIDDTPYMEKISDPLFGWSQRATDGVELYDVPGGHSSCLIEPYVKVLAQQIDSSIRKCLNKESQESVILQEHLDLTISNNI